MSNDVRCSETGKHCYTSQAQATRAINKYDNIRRVYHCNHCKQWHATKIGTNLAIREKIIKPTKRKTVSADAIRKRLDELTKKNENTNR